MPSHEYLYFYRIRKGEEYHSLKSMCPLSGPQAAEIAAEADYLSWNGLGSKPLSVWVEIYRDVTHNHIGTYKVERTVGEDLGWEYRVTENVTETLKRERDMASTYADTELNLDLNPKTVCKQCKWMKRGTYYCGHLSIAPMKTDKVNGQTTQINKKCREVNSGDCPHFESKKPFLTSKKSLLVKILMVMIGGLGGTAVTMIVESQVNKSRNNEPLILEVQSNSHSELDPCEACDCDACQNGHNSMIYQSQAKQIKSDEQQFLEIVGMTAIELCILFKVI